MKKTVVVLVFALICVSAFAQAKGKLGNLFGSTNNERQMDAKTGKIPEGREIFPVLYSEDLVKNLVTNGKKLSLNKLELISENVIDEKYELRFTGLIDSEMVDVILKVSVQDNSFTVIADFAEKNNGLYGASNKASQILVDTVEHMLSFLSTEEYSKKWDKAYSDINVQISIPTYAPNKLKAKQWYTKHSLVDKEIEIPFYFRTIDEANDDVYFLELSGIYGSLMEKNVKVKVLSNNDKYIDTKDNQLLKIKGKVRSVEYADSDNSIKSLVIEEK